MKLAAISILSLPLLAACVPAHVECELDYTVDYRLCNVKESEGPEGIKLAHAPVDVPSTPVDDPIDPLPDDNGDDTKDNNGGDTKDSSREDSNGDNSSDDSNGDNSDEKPKRGKHK